MYSLGRLAGRQCARFEEHLLVCADCQRRLQEADTFVAAMRAAGASYARKPTVRAVGG